MTDEEILRKLIDRPEPIVVSRSEPKLAERISQKPLVVIGTSGSQDYLRDTGDRRFWPVPVAAPTSDEAPDDGQTCDGLHDEDAPALYLCSRCFPYGEISPREDDDGYDRADRDAHEEME